MMKDYKDYKYHTIYKKVKQNSLFSSSFYTLKEEKIRDPSTRPAENTLDSVGMTGAAPVT